MDCTPPGSSVHEDSPGKNIRVGCHALLQGIFSTQESNWGLLHCRWILYQLSYQGSLLIQWIKVPINRSQTKAYLNSGTLCSSLRMTWSVCTNLESSPQPWANEKYRTMYGIDDVCFFISLIFKWIIVVFMCLHFIFWLCPMAYGACGTLVPWPGIEPMLPALPESSLLTNGPPGKSYGICFFNRWAQTHTNQFFKCSQIVVPELGTGSKCEFSDLPPKGLNQPSGFSNTYLDKPSDACKSQRTASLHSSIYTSPRKGLTGLTPTEVSEQLSLSKHLTPFLNKETIFMHCSIRQK